jgi:serine/threonine protein kinase
MESMVGTAIGPYRIVETTGQGGMGTVYRGVHTQLEQEVAIKILSPTYAQDPTRQQRFIAAAQLQAELTHPHVVTLFNALEDDGHLCLIMEYVPGVTLAQHLAIDSRLAQHEAIAICHGVLAALDFMHSKGIIHRSIKPGNIMLTHSGLVKVADFGVVKMAGDLGLTTPGTSVSTLWYMAPEQLHGAPVSAATDVYALGVTFYQMLTGKIPAHLIMRAYMEVAPAIPGEHDEAMPQALTQVIWKALESKPAQRFQSARDFADALTQACQRLDTVSQCPCANDQMPSPSSPSRRLRPWQYVTLAVGGSVILLVLLSMAFFPDGSMLPRPFRLRVSSFTSKQGTPTAPSALPTASVHHTAMPGDEAATPLTLPVVTEMPPPFALPLLAEEFSTDLRWPLMDTEEACELPLPAMASPAAIGSSVRTTPPETSSASTEAVAAVPQAERLGPMPRLISQPREHLSEGPKALPKPAPQGAQPAQTPQEAQRVQPSQTPKQVQESQELQSAQERPIRPPTPTAALNSKRESAETPSRGLRKSSPQPTARDSRGWYIRK